MSAPKSGWESWSPVALAKEFEDRTRRLYGRTDGQLVFPNSTEGDLLRLMEVFLRKTQAARNMEGTPVELCLTRSSNDVISLEVRTHATGMFDIEIPHASYLDLMFGVKNGTSGRVTRHVPLRKPHEAITKDDDQKNP